MSNNSKQVVGKTQIKRDVFTVADSHVANKLLKLGLVKDIAHHAAALDLVQASLVSAGNNTSSILMVLSCEGVGGCVSK